MANASRWIKVDNVSYILELKGEDEDGNITVQITGTDRSILPDIKAEDMNEAQILAEQLLRVFRPKKD